MLLATKHHNFKITYHFSACSDYCTLIYVYTYSHQLMKLNNKHSNTVTVTNVILKIAMVTGDDQLHLATYITQSCAVMGVKYINESALNQTLLDINRNITYNILEVNMTCHQDFINTGDQCEPSCVDTFVHSDIGYMYILTDVCSGLIASSHLLGGSVCIIIAIIGRKYV